VAKYAKEFEDNEIDECMWCMDDMSDYMKSEKGGDPWYDEVYPKMKQIVIWSLESVQDTVENRKCSFEI